MSTWLFWSSKNFVYFYTRTQHTNQAISPPKSHFPLLLLPPTTTATAATATMAKAKSANTNGPKRSLTLIGPKIKISIHFLLTNLFYCIGITIVVTNQRAQTTSEVVWVPGKFLFFHSFYVANLIFLQTHHHHHPSANRQTGPNDVVCALGIDHHDHHFMLELEKDHHNGDAPPNDQGCRKTATKRRGGQGKGEGMRTVRSVHPTAMAAGGKQNARHTRRLAFL